ncbi:hypothetical protein AB7M63_003602 [Bradyrhizobium japonicum]
MLTFNDSELEALDSGGAPLGVFFRLETDPVVRLWLGFGDIAPGINAYDSDGAVYRGLGELQNVPAINQLINGAAERVEFVMSGVSGEVLQISQGDDAEAIQGARADVGIGLMGQDWGLLGSLHWMANYVADILSGQQQPARPGDPIIRLVSLSAGTRFTRRRRPSLSYFTEQDQKRRFPGDRACDLVTDYAHGFGKTWPVF